MDPVRVSYDLTDVLDKLNSSIAANHGELKGLIAGKADKSDVSRLEGALEAHRKETDSRLRPLEEERRSREDRQKAREEHEGEFFTRRQRFWAVVYALVSLGIFAFIGPLVSHLLAGH